MAGIFVVLLGLDVKHDQMFKLIAVIWGGVHVFLGFLALATKEPM